VKVIYKNTMVTIKMTTKQLESFCAVFESFTDQVDERDNAYSDCVRNINILNRAIVLAKDVAEGVNQCTE
jgi:hypothetical protein